MLKKILELLALKWLWTGAKDAADLRQHSPAPWPGPTMGALGHSKFNAVPGWLVSEAVLATAAGPWCGRPPGRLGPHAGPP